MANNLKRLDSYLVPGKHIHLIGIGGVSMRPLGLVLRGMGITVTGSDMNASVSTDELIAKGIEVHIGHRAENIQGADCIIRTAAAHNDNPEVAAARAQGIPVFERAQAWGVIMREYKNAICVSGTHGKTTTTGMLTHIFMQAQRDPTVMMGGYLPLLHAGHRVGSGDTIIMESCEYCDSFLNFYPTVAIVNNIEADHLDYFKDLDAVKRSFRKFAGLVPRTGHVIANGDDANTVQTLSDLHYLSFGIDAHNDIHPEGLSEDLRSFDIICFGKRMWTCRSTAATMSIMRWPPQAPHGSWAWTARMSPRALPRSTARAAAWSSRGRTTARTFMMTMPTIPVSCTPSSTPWPTWAISA